jgi:hypothetical protein
MVYKEDADGMVSGAAHTHATYYFACFAVYWNSSIPVLFLLCFFAFRRSSIQFWDCAINPNPTTEQLAEIAISSADSSMAFFWDRTQDCNRPIRLSFREKERWSRQRLEKQYNVWETSWFKKSKVLFIVRDAARYGNWSGVKCQIQSSWSSKCTIFFRFKYRKQYL